MLYFTGCSVVLFGSSVNGFGVKGCDIDIFLDISHLMPSVRIYLFIVRYKYF